MNAPSPLLRLKDCAAPSVFQPEKLLREARRQKGLAVDPIPALGVLDPDGDIVRHLQAANQARPVAGWPCYHSQMVEASIGDQRLGFVGCAVGASYAVLVAEQFFAAGGQFLISVTSAGQLAPKGPTPYFVLIERALRDEGTSHHYQPPADYALADPALLARLAPHLDHLAEPVHRGGVWTTDAPFRETEAAIAAHSGAGLLAVEMEAAALYAFAQARQKPVVCFAHVTNRMGEEADDFEKGEAGGARAALALIEAVARAWRAWGGA
ncbi:MAG: nucleoside phosphorylase [Rhodospirillales bacterium]|nr:nucleoside phosphorylase [Rhodospirillales bacterium]